MLLIAAQRLYETNPVTAQTGPVRVALSGGTAVPLGDLGDVTNANGSLGVEVGYAATSRLTLFLSATVDGFAGTAAIRGTDISLWRLTTGVQYDLAPSDSRWRVALRAGAGTTTTDSDDFGLELRDDKGELIRDLGATYPSVESGISVGFAATRWLELFGTARWYAAFGDGDDSAGLVALSNGLIDPLSTYQALPITGGIRFRL